MQLFRIKSDWRLNPEVPTLSPGGWCSRSTRQIWVLERNPYFYAVDTAGNQLPYIDKVQLTLAENPEVINLRAIAGEYDYMERFIDLAKLPVFLENAERGNYKVHLDPGFNGADSELYFNFAYRADPEIQKWFAKSSSAARCRSASTASRSTRRSCSASARRLADPGRYHPGKPRARNGGCAGRRSTWPRPTRCWMRSA